MFYIYISIFVQYIRLCSYATERSPMDHPLYTQYDPVNLSKKKKSERESRIYFYVKSDYF